MKWLIFLLLISCGKQEQPKSKEVKDHDGDLIVMEDGIQDFIAEVGSIGKVQGALLINGLQIDFNNDPQERFSPASYLVNGMSPLERKAVLDHDGRLNINFEQKLLIQDINQVKILFDADKIKFKDLVFIDGNTEKNLGTWSSEMNFSLSRTEVENLRKGKSFLLLRKDFRTGKNFNIDSFNSINEKTRRVLVQDSEIRNILFSKDYSEEDILKNLKVPSTKDFNIELLYNGKLNSEEAYWFIKRSAEGDLFIVHTNLLEIKKLFDKKFDKKIDILTRVNGQKSEAIKIQRDETGKAYFKVRPINKRLRSFYESEEKKEVIKLVDLPIKHYERNRCKLYYRRSSNSNLTPELNDFISNLSEKVDLKKEFFITEQSDEKGPYWNIMISSSSAAAKLELTGLDTGNSKAVGLYNVSCENHLEVPRIKVSWENPEQELTFEIESYIPKI